MLVTSPAYADLQTREQQKCINAINKDVAKVARAQAGDSTRCIQAAGRGLLGNQTAQQCVSADNRGKVGLAAAKTLADEVKLCSPPPDFGYTGGSASNLASIEEDVSLLADVFGSPLQDAIVTAEGTRCQAKVAKAYAKLAQTKLKEFLRCKKAGLKTGAIDSAAQLDECTVAITNDVRQKVAKARSKILKTLAGSGCFAAAPALDMAALFPGTCSAEATNATALTQCIDVRVECRVCRLINLVDDLVRDCDDFDDGQINASCDSTLPTCDDGKRNQDETDVDCGGSTCPVCPADSACLVGGDCASGVCLAGFCRAPTCSDSVANGSETDVDCGGPTCPQCPTGGGCTTGTDCQSLVCSAGTCLAPTCGDLIKNGDETGTDCGGSCAPCPPGAGCNTGADCQSFICTGGLCTAPSCSDGIENGTESDVDCGGTCPGCPDGGACNSGPDCQNGVCGGGICLAPTCTDGVANGIETDVDCGGGTCPTCALGRDCNVSADCTSTLCQGGVCSCGSQMFTFGISSNNGGVFDSAEWPGGTAAQNGLPGCNVSINRPSGNIDLVGTLGDDFEVIGFSGYSSCFGTGGEDGDGCQPDSCPPAGIPFCQDRRPSCSAALNGSGSARFFVQCNP
jgi:hypothetical protein